MTRVCFHVLPTQAPAARLRYLIHLLNQPLSGTCHLRLPDEAAAQRLDLQLWKIPAESFLPHALGSEHLPAPIQLWGADIPCTGDTLINLHPDFPEHAQGYRTVIELLDQSPELIERGRHRYKRYKALGITPDVIKPQER